MPPEKGHNHLTFLDWPQGTTFRQSKVIFRGEIVSGSSCPNQLVSWLQEIDQSTHLSDLDHPGCVLSTSAREFETVDAQIAKALGDILSKELRKKR